MSGRRQTIARKKRVSPGAPGRTWDDLPSHYRERLNAEDKKLFDLSRKTKGDCSYRQCEEKPVTGYSRCPYHVLYYRAAGRLQCPPDRTCVGCGFLFSPRRDNQDYCHAACRKRCNDDLAELGITLKERQTVLSQVGHRCQKCEKAFGIDLNRPAGENALPRLRELVVPGKTVLDDFSIWCGSCHSAEVSLRRWVGKGRSVEELVAMVDTHKPYQSRDARSRKKRQRLLVKPQPLVSWNP